MQTALFVVTVIIVLSTFLPVWQHSHWLIRALDFPRFQIAVLASILFVIQCLVFQWDDRLSLVGLALTGLCVLWQLWWILPYTRLWPQEVKTASIKDENRTLTFLTSNVLATNKNSDALIELVKQHRPDVLVTLESNHWWQSQLRSLEQDMPFTMKCPLENLYGMHVYSRYPLTDKRIAFLVEDDVPSMHANLTLESGDVVRVHFVHPAPPSPTENTHSSERDAELSVLARQVSDETGPIIVTGDLNDVAWSATTRLFRKVSGLLDPRVGRGMFNTFHAGYPFLRWPLDHVFHSSDFTLGFIKRMPSIGSDHFPLLTQLIYRPNNGLGQDGLDHNPADQERAKQLANNQGVDKSEVPASS
jgi:endonuclease/exonuclease/phosphatase (EEP) superfamily protein YafD